MLTCKNYRSKIMLDKKNETGASMRTIYQRALQTLIDVIRGGHLAAGRVVGSLSRPIVAMCRLIRYPSSPEWVLAWQLGCDWLPKWVSRFNDAGSYFLAQIAKTLAGSIAVLLFATGVSTAQTIPTYPVLFVHGLISDGSSWEHMGIRLWGQDEALKGARLRVKLDANGQASGASGCDYSLNWSLKVTTFSPLVDSDSYWLGSKRYFAIDFSANRDMDLFEQSKELKEAIGCVKQVTGMPQVILVTHSMGGLAARYYLQGMGSQASPLVYGGDVQKLVTIGTPHGGAAHTIQQATATSLVLGPLLGEFALKQLGPRTVGLLARDSWWIRQLNLAPALPDIPYVSIKAIQRGLGFAADLVSLYTVGEGDGIVPLASQSMLNSVPLGTVATNGQQLRHTEFQTVIQDEGRIFSSDKVALTSACQGLGAGEAIAHLCETKNNEIVRKVRSELSSAAAAEFFAITSGATAVSPTQVRLNGTYTVSDPSALTIGISWRVNAGPTNEATQTSSAVEGAIAATISSGVLPTARIYYRAFVRKNGVTSYGRERQFFVPNVVGPLQAPVLQAPLNGAVISGSPTISWLPVENADRYRLFVAKSSDSLPSDRLVGNCSGCEVQQYVGGTSSRLQTSDVSPGGIYFWRVLALDGAGPGELSSIRQFSVANDAPFPAPSLSAPAEAAVLQVGNWITLSWQPVPNATSYRVFVADSVDELALQPIGDNCTSRCVQLAIVGQEAKFEFNSAGLSPGRSYYWTVKARSPTRYGAVATPRRFTFGQSQCAFNFAQSSLSASASGGALPISISTQPACVANVTSNQSYCTLSSGSVVADNSGQASVTTNVSANTSSSIRTCTVTLGSVAVTVTQAGTAPPTAYSFTLNQASGGTVTSNPGNGTYSVGTNINLTASPTLGFKFAGWQDGGTIVSTAQNWNFSLFGTRTITPVFNSTVTTITGLVSPNSSPDQKWRILGTGLGSTNAWQSHGETASVIGGNTYRVDCADTPYFEPVAKTFSVTVPGSSSFTCSYTAKALAPPTQALTLRPQPKLASSAWNSLARLDDGRVVIWGLSQFTDFPNYSVNSQNFGGLGLQRPLFLPNSTDVVGVSLGANVNSGMFTLSSGGIWKRWGNPVAPGIRIPTPEPSLNDFIRMNGDFGLVGWLALVR